MNPGGPGTDYGGSPGRGNRHRKVKLMALGLGFILLLAGLVLVLDVIAYDIPRVDDYQLGVLLIIVGVAAIVLTLVMGAMRTRRATIEEHHYDHAPRS